MEYLAYVVGIGIVSFLMFYFSNIIDDTHNIMKFLTLFFGLGLLLLIPTAVNENQTSCDNVVNQTFYDGNYTTYTYDSFCYTQDINGVSTFYKTLMWFYRIFIAYIIIFLGYKSIMALKDSISMKGKK